MMNEEKDNPEPKQNEEPEKPLCTCMYDPFNSLPPDFRPRPKDVLDGLRNCPAFGFSYWTNRDTDLCIECEKKVVVLPGI
jgi:hypothetical protein